MNIKISVIVPVYKIREEFLNACLKSIIGQTLQEIQIILVDDGSLDVCSEICDLYASQDARITVLHQSNQGVSCARNNGLALANGEYVLFIDGDDMLAQDACEKLYKEAQRVLPDILLYGFKCVQEGTESIHLLGIDVVFSPEEIKQLQKTILNPGGKYLVVAPAGTVGKMFNRDFLIRENLQYVPGLKRMQDNVFNLTAYMRTSNIAYFNYMGYIYRIHGDSVCNKYNSDIFNIMENVLHAMSSCIQENGDDTLENMLQYTAISILENEYMRIFFRHPENPMPRKQRITAFQDLIKREPYSTAIKTVSLKELTPHGKMITFLLKRRQVRLLWALLDIENCLRKRQI